jgi:hypothetical protein
VKPVGRYAGVGGWGLGGLLGVRGRFYGRLAEMRPLVSVLISKRGGRGRGGFQAMGQAASDGDKPLAPQLFENKMVNTPLGLRVVLYGNSPNFRRLDNPVMATQFEAEPAICWSRIGVSGRR